MRTTKKLAAVLMLVSFIFSTVSPAMAAGLADITDIAGGNGGNALGNASTIYFGNYWQNAKSGKSGSTNLNDYNKEGIKWRVLSNADGKTLLLSDQGLYADAFNHSDSPSKDNVWKYSHVRAILNNTTADDGFAGDAFSDKEYAAIAETTLSDVDSTDKIFLLSADEVQNTDYGFAAGTSANDTRKALATEMAQHIPVYGNAYYSRSTVDLFDGYPYWWLRSPGGASKKAYCVGNEGDVNYTYGDIGYCDDAVRPALNLNQESVLFLSAAVATKSDGTNYDKNSKSQVGVGDGFALADYDGSNGWKLTLFDKYDATEDTGIKTPNVTQAEIVGKTWDVNDLAETAKTGTKIIEISDQTPTGDEGLKIAYNGAATGTNMYVSALLKDKTTGNYVNYAKVSQDAADTEIIDVSGISGNYTLCIYGEQENGDYQTDYASELYRKDITIPTDMPAPTVNKILSSDYAAGGLTAKISNDCELGFEAGEYDTAVTIEDDKSGKITADASGTTLTGNISVGTDATLTTANTFTLDGAISGEGTIENTGTLNVNGTLAAAVTNNDSVTAKSGSTINSTVTNAAAATTTLETGAAFGAAGKISGGTAVLKENVEFTASNLDGITAFNADKAIYNFSATLNSADPYITAGNIINVDGNATGTIKLGTITLNGTSSDGWAVGTPEEMQYLNATGTDTNLTVDGYQVQTNTGYKYTFSQAKDGSADKIGYMSVLKESETELTLKDLVNNTSTAAGSTNQYTVDGLDETTTEDLGALDNTLRGGKFAIVGSNGDPATDILDGNGNGGIIVADTEHGGAAGDELTLKDITVQNFTPAVTNKEGGTVSLENVIFKNNEDWDIVNEGTVNLTKTNEFDKGISGADGAIVVKDGASLTGQSEGATTITTDTLDGNGDLTAENITINVTGDGGSIVGNLTLEDMTITGAGVDATEETVAGLNLNGTVTVENITITSGGATNISNGGTVNGNGKENAVINTGTLTPAGDMTVSDITINVAGATTAADGAEYTGNGEETAVINTDTLNGNGDLTAENITINVTGDGGSIAGNLTLEDMTITGAGVYATEETVAGLNLNGTVTVENITITSGGATNISNGGTVTGNGKDTAVINTDTLTGEGNAEVKEITINVNDKLDVEKDLTVTNADVNVKGDIEIGGNVSITGTEDDHAKINFDGEGTIGGNVALDNGELNGGKLDINGNLDTKGGSSISGDVTLYGYFNINDTTKIAGTFMPKGALNFNLDGEEKKNGYVFIDNTAAAEPMDLSEATVNLIQTDEYYKLNKGETMTLVTKAINYMGDPEVQTREGVKKYLYSVGLDETSALMLGYLDQGVADQTKSFSEARLAGSAAINSASDLVASAVMENATAETKDWEAFAAIQGAHSRYETGSHIDLNSTNVAAGLSKKVKDNVTLGLFVEGGNGRYTTENEFEDGNVRADGDINYFGGGVFLKAEGKKTAKGQLHGEASFRAGHINSDYNSETFEIGTHTRFDTSEAYLGAHLGLGYKWSLKDNSNIDTYVKYLWNRQNSDSPVIDGEQFDLDAINSHRLRAGFRYNSKENENGVKFFGGLAYEYEFDGAAKGHMGEYALLEPDFKGGSGMAELGIKYHKANSPWKVELGLTGYTGKRDSIGAHLNAWYEFGK